MMTAYSGSMRSGAIRLYLVACAAVCAFAQTSPFTLDQVMGAAFPTHLTAARTGGRVAWVSNRRGVINIMVAEPPNYVARQISHYMEDDGQDLVELAWTPDAQTLVYVRGEGPNRQGESPNPALDPRGAGQTIWAAGLDATAPRRLGEGSGIAISPRGDRVAFVHHGQVWWAPLDGSAPAAQLFEARGEAQQLAWSPDGARLAFASDRGDHGFTGCYDLDSRQLRYLDPSTDFDSDPAWSPDGRSVAFIRQPSHGKGRIYGAQRADEPWSIRLADAKTGHAREIWKANAGPGSVFRGVSATQQLWWADGNRVVFPWEGDGWTHLYSISTEAKAQPPLRLTPGDFEVEFVTLAPDNRSVIFSSNEGDLDRRHLWRVPAAGGAPQALTPGQGIEWSPVVTNDGRVAFLHSDAQHPAHPAMLLSEGREIHELDPAAIPPDFPASKMVTPLPVTFPSQGGLTIHGQLFLPLNSSRSRSPAVIFFHGGPRRQMLLGWHYMSYYSNTYAFNQYLASRGYVVLSVNYRSGIGYGLDFREALNYGSTGASEFADVEAAGQFLRARPEVDSARVGVWGGSYGGYLTAMALAKSSGVFRAGVDFHGVHDWSLEYDLAPGAAATLAFNSSPMAFVSGWRSPVLLVHGDDDRSVKFTQTVILADTLRQQKVPVEELIFPDEVHEFLLYRHWREAFEAAGRFLDKHLKP